jgi:hypothetical protein
MKNKQDYYDNSLAAILARGEKIEKEMTAADAKRNAEILRKEEAERGCKFELRVASMVVCPEGEPIYSDACTVVSIVDEGDGEYVCVTQHDEAPGLYIDAALWPDLRETIDHMIAKCRQ